MKKILIILTTVCLAFSSCADYLDVSDELASNLTVAEVFENVAYTKRWHAYAFNSIPNYSNIFWVNDAATRPFGNPWTSLAGETTVNWGVNKTESINGYTPGSASFHRYTSMYKYIRQAYIFLNNGQPIGNTMDKASISEADMNRMKSEMKFLVGFMYFSLFELYGPVPLITDEVDLDSDVLDFPRATTDELVNYIDQLYAEVLQENYLPETLRERDPRTGEMVENLSEIVRPTRAVVLAARAKLWVYAASKLFNGGYKEAVDLTDNDGVHIFPAYDAEKWVKAKQHLKTFLDFAHANDYRLYVSPSGPSMSVYQVFQDYNNEVIWASGVTNMNKVDDGQHLDRRCTPRDIYDGFSGIGVSQQSVDAFFTKNGLTIDEDPEYDETGFTDIENPCAYNAPQVDKQVFNMYVNREPRFYHAVTYHGKSWHIQPRADYQIRFSRGGNNDNFTTNREHYSGYLLYKRCNQELLNTGSYLKSYARPSIIFRLADFYLYYAEVCNEINPADPEIIEYLDKVRERAGIPGYRELHTKGIKTNVIGNYEAQGFAIRRERQVELFTEGQRYFDIRRWMICEAGQEADRTIYIGMNVDGFDDVDEYPLGSENSYFRRKVVQEHNWTRAMYLYPIPQDEINKSTKLVQNPLW